MKHSLKSRLLGEVLVTSDVQAAAPLRWKALERTREGAKSASFMSPHVILLKLPQCCRSAIPQQKIKSDLKKISMV